MTAAYMRILIHTMNNSLFPDADPSTTTWTGPPPEIVTIQSLLYASLTTSLFAAFLAMLGKQWINQYLRNRGGSAADKGRDRQRKLDGFKTWHFHLAIESLPVMLQLALLLLGCALSKYLWTISCTVAGVVVTVTIFGVSSYILFTLAATIYYNCPYQTPPSILTRTTIKYLTHSDTRFTHALRSITTPLLLMKLNCQTLRHLCARVHRAFRSLSCIPGIPEETGHIPLAVVTSLPPARIFEDIPIDWDAYKADILCISWILSTSTDADVIYSTVRFAADTIWYPEIVGTLSPHVLANFFFDCLLDGKVIPGKSEHMSSIGMALASVLGNHLITNPENWEFRDLCRRIGEDVHWPGWSDQTLSLVVSVLQFMADIGAHECALDLACRRLGMITPDNLPTMQKLWLSRVTLQALWRWRCIEGPTWVPRIHQLNSICSILTADRSRNPSILKTNCFLTMAITLGLQIDIRDLYAPNNKCVPPSPIFSQGVHSLSGSNTLQVAANIFYQQLQISIRERKTSSFVLTSILSTLDHLDPVEVKNITEICPLWLADILNSGYPDNEQHDVAIRIIQLLGKRFCPIPMELSWIPPLLDFLSLCEKLHSTKGFTALRILSSNWESSDFGTSILPVLTPILLPTHPLQSRVLALKIFYRFAAGWFSLQMENILHNDLDKFLQAVGDPFQFPDHSLHDGQSMDMVNYNPMKNMVILIQFASSDLWRNFLHPSNFSSCEEICSTAIEIIKILKVCPIPSSKLKLEIKINNVTDNNINSIAIIIRIIFFLFNINPKIPTKNKSNDRFMVCICLFIQAYIIIKIIFIKSL